MDQRQFINHRQLAFMASIILIGGGLISLPHELIKISEGNAWLSELFPAVYALLVAFLLYILARKFPGKNLFQIIFELGGKWVGGAMNAVILFTLWMMMVRNIRGLADIIKTTLLRQTPEEVIILLFMLVVLYYGKQTIEVTARANDLLFTGFLLLTMGLPLVLANEFSFDRIQPVLVGSIVKLYYTGWINIGWYGDLIVLGAFLHMVSVAKQVHSALRLGIFLSSLILTLFAFMDIGVLGHNLASRAVYPDYTLVQQIHISEFLDRLEVVVFSIWLPIFVIKLSVIYTAILIGISSFARTKNYVLFNKSLSWFTIITSILAFNGLNEMFDFGNLSSVVITLCTQVPIFSILIVQLIRRNARDRSKNDQPKQEASLVGRPYQKGWSGISYRRWIIISNWLVAGGILVIHIGWLFGKTNPVIANMFALLYAILLILAVCSAAMEVRLARNIENDAPPADNR